ncbi:TonB-dependent receptor [Parasediminibacterium sp. JCM 36343]|uniref:TonB-dependent receptor n=1 Tax=Parasediminibacterium sp. JCM 36343 TaxID=3374279 RepID=UPI003978DF48
MKKLMSLLLLVGATTIATAQTIKKMPKDSAVIGNKDSVLQEELKENLSDNIPVISLDDNDVATGNSQSVSSALTAGRDPFTSAASFNFGAARFKLRGYDADNFTTRINGAPLENLDNGFSPFGLWGGLNDVMRNKDVSNGLRPNTFAFGGLGSSTSIDARASKQRPQTEFGYTYANRSYRQRWSFTHSTGVSKKGWAFTISGSRRYADEGYVEGTYYNGWSYFVGIDKKIGQNRTLSLTIFGSPTEAGGQRASTSEMDSLAGSHYYNPTWGYQAGKKRNTNVTKTNQPYFIFTDEKKFNNKSTLVNAASFSFGERAASSLDWYQGNSPTPDYYRNLPSYYDEPYIVAAMGQAIQADINKRQINWQAIYDGNRGRLDTITNAYANGMLGQTVKGSRSNTILAENVTNVKKVNFSSTFNTKFGNHVAFTAGVVFQAQNDRNYKRVKDLLGGDFYVDINKFAVDLYDPTVRFPDLSKPNNVVKVGDQYSYDYNVHINKAEAFSQGVFKFKQLDFFVAGQVSNTQFWREGNTLSSIYPNSSFGKSYVNNFDNFGLKGGITYKLNGRNYFYVNGEYATKAPDFRSVYISPRTRDQEQDNVRSETITSVEGGYLMNAPFLKLRVSGYYTEFKHQMDVMSFFNDDVFAFTNYALRNIDKVNFGGELGFEARVLPHFTVTGAAAVGRYYYNSRQNATVTNDNSGAVVAQDTIYTQNFRISGTPQEAYSLGLNYRSPKYWYISLTGNYFDQMWASINPIRRTKDAVSDAVPYSAAWYDIVGQKRLPGQFTLDLFAGYSWKLPRHWLHKNSFLNFNFSIDNILDNKNLITGGGEQLRFDFAKLNVDKFPPKYYYAYGLNFAASVALRF